MSHNDDVSLLRLVILKKTKKDISNLSVCFVLLTRGKDIPKYYTYTLHYLWETSIKMSVRVVLSLLLSKKRDVLYCKWNIICKFAESEGRNPWVKNAFLALSHVTKSPNFSRGMRTMQRSFCLYTPRTAHAVPHKVYTTAWGICFSVHFYDGVWRCQ